MLLPTIRRWLAVVAMSFLLGTMSLPLAMAPSVALAQGTSLSVVPTSGPPNTLVTATGNGFPAYDTRIQIWFDQINTGKTATADASGHFSVNFNVPSNVTLGLHPVYATDGRNYASTSFTVIQQKTPLSIASIAVDDQNWNAKKAFTQGNEARFVVYVHNSSSSSDSATLKATVISGSGVTLLNSNPWNVTIPGNSTPGYVWKVTIPQSAPPGLYYYHAIVTNSLGSVDGWAVFTVRNSISYNPYPDSSQCTWKAEDLMHTATGLYMPNFGDAHSWRDNAGPNGWIVGSTPETSSIMVMQYANGYKYLYWNTTYNQWVQTSINSVGHVGWVTSLGYNGSMVYLVDRNWSGTGQDGGRWIWISGAPVNFIYS